jgi:alkaline phosphatase
MSFGDLLWDIKEFKNFKHYGFVKPYPIESKYHITDSAAAGTAISCGEKTKVGTIAMDEKGKKLESVAYLAKKKGKSVGVVTNTRITHATPAVFYANNINRENEEEIARQISESHFDLFIGGGWKYVYPISDNLKKNGYDLIREKKDMNEKYKKELSWELSYSFGRALQQEGLKAWGGKMENIPQAQKVFLERCKKVSEARG